ncbi:MAG: YihY/virulence factor BrkB family protein [Proteobacteria bacterium]|nr:YihY/virulence factor BrkB family protein [Pseudomonadota bacterium]
MGRNYHKLLIEASSSFVKNGCPNMSAAIAFYAILSTIPLIFIFVAGLGFVFEGADKPMESVFAALEGVMPSLAAWLKNEVTAVESKKGVIGGFGLIFMLWSSTLVFSSLEFSFTRIFHVENRRSFIRSKLVSLGLVITGVVVLAASIMLSTIAQIAKSKMVTIGGINVTDFFSASIFVQYLLPLLMLTAIFTTFYIVLSRRTVTFKEALCGALICAFFFEGAKHLFTWYIKNMSSHSAVYGSLAAIVILILWFFYAAIIILFCGELIAAWKRQSEGQNE